MTETPEKQSAGTQVEGDSQNPPSDDFKDALPPGMTKKIIQEGEGDEYPEDGYEVTVHYTGTFEDGKEFDSSHSRGSPFNFTLGSGSVIKGWEIGLKTMKRNEIAEFSLPPELAYGEQGSPPTIPPNTRLNFIIELMDWALDSPESQKPVYRMTLEERIAKCQEKKNAGGSHFKEGKYDMAIRQYRDIMKLAEISEFRDDGKVVELDSCQDSKLPPESDQDKALRSELKQMLLVGYLNLALCYLKSNKLKECIANCDQALELDPKNVKAHFRKGLAYLPTNDHERALKQFEIVLEIDPNNAEAKARKNECHTAIRNYYQKQKDVYKNLFAKRA